MCQGVGLMSGRGENEWPAGGGPDVCLGRKGGGLRCGEDAKQKGRQPDVESDGRDGFARWRLRRSVWDKASVIARSGRRRGGAGACSGTALGSQCDA